LWDAYETGGLVLLDEVDNGNPNLLAALNSALSNGHCVFGSGTVVEKHPAFRVVATANTAGLGPEHGYIGRNGVDLATRDRFVTVEVPIDDSLERALALLAVGDDEGVKKEATDRAESSRAKLQERATAATTRVGPETILKKVRHVRERVEARFRGSVVSPRATIHAATMTTVGFSLEESLAAKLPGLSPDELRQIING
jgi:MoxR-like ATPase